MSLSRYEAIQDGKNWRVIDNETGELADGGKLGMHGHPVVFDSSRGLRASTLAYRARSAARHLNERLEKLGTVRP